MFMRKMRKDRRGLTLIELICAVAILGIISATVGGAMVVATDSYRNGTEETSLQSEAQFTVNAIEALIIDATDTVEFDGSLLKITNVDYTYEISFDADAKTLHYTQYETNNSGNVTAANELLAEHVKNFEVDASQFPTARNVKLTLTMENSRGRDFTTAYNITSRNNPDAGAPIDVSAVISVPELIVLEPNQNYPLSVNVYGPANQDYSAVFVEGASELASGTSLTKNGSVLNIQIGQNETGGADGALHIYIATSATGADGGPLKFTTVTVMIRRINTIVFENVFNVQSGLPYKQGTVYTVDAIPSSDIAAVVPFLEKQLGAAYDDDYVPTDTVEWYKFEADDGDDYVEVIGGTNGKTLTFKLKKDLPEGIGLRVYAKSLHSEGANKTGLQYDFVDDKVELKNGNSGIYPVGDLRRGTEGLLHSSLDPQKLVEQEWQRNHPGEALTWENSFNGGFGGNIYFRYYSTDTSLGLTSPDYPEWIRFTDQGNGVDFKFNASDFDHMKFVPDYTIEILYSYRYNNGNNQLAYYPAAAYPGGPYGTNQPLAHFANEEAYIYTVPIKGFTLRFTEYHDGAWDSAPKPTAPYETADGTGLGTMTNPLPVEQCQSVQLRVTSITGATATRGHQQKLRDNTKIYQYNGTVWEPVNNMQIRFDEGVSGDDYCYVSFSSQNLTKGVTYKMVMQSLDPSDPVETYANEPVDGEGGRGIVYFKVQ